MTDDQLEKLDDSELENVIGRAQGLLAARKEQRRKDALEAARAKLAEAGLTPADLMAATRKKSAKSDVIAGGQVYVNPENPKQKWTSGRGRRPSWFKALEKKGKTPSPEKA
jgi:DNA-binding protein H-NS